MIISRTPFRISFFGGGTDYPVWFEEHGGAVLCTTINKYCHISCRYLPPFFKHKSRVVYSTVETVESNDAIQHPAVRETLKFLGIKGGVEIHHDGDLPARTGLGSSSSFSVGLLHALYALKQVMPTRMHLATEAIYVEQNLLKENVGCQDQVAAAFGGFSRIEFLPSGGGIRINPVIISRERLEAFQSHLVLYFTGFTRIASEIAREQIETTAKRVEELTRIREMVEEGLDILCGREDLTAFGKLLGESWKVKQSLTHKISTPKINEIYGVARDAGAVGGKLLGAGGGGFMLLFVKPEDQPKVDEKLKGLLRVPFSFENRGSEIIFYQLNPELTQN